MKKTLAIIIPIVLVLCVLCGVVLYFVWQSSGKQIMDSLQKNVSVNVSTTVTNPSTDTTNPDDSVEPNTTTTPDDTNGANNEVCQMLTLDIAKQILGTDAKLGSQNAGNCTYSAFSEDMSSFGVLTMVVTKSNVVTAKANFEQAKTLSYSGKTEAVTGLKADDAYFATGLMQLSILKGDSWIIISGTSDKYASEKELAVATAKLVLK